MAVAVPMHDLTIVEATTPTELTSRPSKSSNTASSRSTEWARRYLKVIVLTVILLGVLASSAIPLASKIQTAESVGDALVKQWSSLALRSGGGGNSFVNSTTIVAAAAPSAV